MPERYGPENWRILKKSQLRLDHGDWKYSSLPWSLDLGIRSLSRRVEFSTVAAADKFFGSLPAEMNWDLKHHEMCRTLRGGVSIEWLRTTFKNCVSHFVSKNRSKKLINRWYLNNRFRLYLPVSACVFAYVFVVPLLLISLWLWLRAVCNNIKQR